MIGGSGIKAIYTTDIQRTKGTVESLASYLGINPEVYGKNFKDFSDKVLSQHQGEVVMVIGHDSTLERIIEALIGKKPEHTPGIQFDDLHSVTIDTSGKGNVVSIKYGNPIGPDKCKKSKPQCTVSRKRNR